MRFFRLVVNNKVVVYILLLLIVIIGAFSYSSMPRESSPSIQIPYVFITTVYPGVSPQDIESLVTQEIEKEIKGIKDIKEISSISRESFSSIVIEFEPSVQIDDALQKVRDKVSVAKTKMPTDINEPVITEINFSELPMMYVNLSGNYGLAQLKDFADNLSDKIEAIPGVLSAEVVGGLEREVKVNVDADRLKYYNLSLNDVTDAIKFENQSIPGGSIDMGSSNYMVRVPGEIENPEIIGDIVVKSFDGKPIYVRDVAQVIYGYKERETYSRENGLESITLIIKKRSGENLVGISEEIKTLLENEKLILPEGIKISVTGDQSKHIINTVHELENGIITGMLLVVMVLFLFLGFRNAALTATSIPLSFLITFVFLDIMGITLNMIVLFSLILVLGIIVDDAIVVMENIYRLQEKEGYNAYDAAIEGPREVVFPVSVATLTIISSFFPLLFFPGIVGEFMKYLPITLIISLFSSLFVAMVISPVQAAVFINVKKEKEKAEQKKFRPIGKLVEKFDNAFFSIALKYYERTLRKALARKKLTISITFAFLIFIFVIYGIFNNGVEFFPEVDPQQAYINIKMPIGTNVENTNEFTKAIEEKLPAYKDIEYYITNVGSSNNPLDFSGSGISNKSTITLNFLDKAEREQSSFTTIENIRSILTGIAGGDIQIEKERMGPPTGPPVNIELAGDDFIKLGTLSNQIKKEIQDIPGITDMKDDFDEARPEIKITVDREKAGLYQLSTSSIAGTIRTAINGTSASKYRVADEEYDITVRLEKGQRDNIAAIENLYIANKDGIKVPLSSVARIEFSGGIGAINRKDLNRVVTISANAEGRLANDVLKDVQKKLENFNLPSGYTMSFTGEQEEQQETSDFLAKAFVISLLMIFMLIVMEFNSITTPLIIMSSVVLSLTGVLIGLLVTRTPFGIIMTGIGVISLGGIVVRNAIVLLDFQKILQKRGLSRDESIIQSGIIRMRPVFLTAITTMLGLVPLTTGVDFDWRSFSWVVGGENTAFWQPMGVAIIFGLAISTFLTLIIVPTLYALVDDIKLKLSAKRRKAVSTETTVVSA